MPTASDGNASTTTGTTANGTTPRSSKWTQRSIFLSFLGLWIAYGLLNQLNSIRGIRFDPAEVVWSQEVLKIVLSLLLFFVQDGGPRRLAADVGHHWSMVCWYGIPAGLYALGDVLTYVNLRSFDPATLHLLGEMKLVVTAVVHQLFFHRRLNRCHWTALVLITLGCIIKAVDSMELSSGSGSTADDVDVDGNGNDNYDANDDANLHMEQQQQQQQQQQQMPHPTAFNYAMIALNIALSTVAGVYNEKLLKDKPHLSINLQNMCLYLDGIIFLTLGMLFGLSETGSIVDALSPSSLKTLFSQPTVLSMAVIMSVAGIVTSRFLKVFDSIRKSVAVALVVVSLPFLSRICFGTPITAKMLVACALVIGGMYLYTSQPPPKVLEDANGEDRVARVAVEEEEEGDEAELFLPAIPMMYGREDSSADEQEMTSVPALSTVVMLIMHSPLAMHGHDGEMKRRATPAASSTPSASSMAIPLGSSDESGTSSGGDVSERQSLVSSLEIFHDDGDDEHKSATTKRPSSPTGQITSLQASASIAKAIMGAGSFSLPWAFAQTGYVAGPILMLIMAGLSVSLLKTLVRCRRLLHATKGTVSYVDVARAAFGDTGANIVYCASISASVGVCGSYLVFIAASLATLMPDAYAQVLGQTQLVLLILPAAVMLSSVRDSNRFAITALLGDVSVLLGMAVVMIYGFLYRGEEDLEDDEGSNKGIAAFGSIDGFALSFGAIGFLFFIHFLVLPIEGSMRNPENFDRVVSLTFLACALISALFGVAGYSFFGDSTEQIVILNIKGSFFVSCVKILLCIDLLFTYPVVMRPSVLILEESLSGIGSEPSRLGVCSGLGAIAAGAGIFIPAFALLSGLVGGVCQTFLAFVMPPLMLQSLRRGNGNGKNSSASCKGLAKTPNSYDEIKAFACVAFGVGMILWTIGSTWSEMRLAKE